MLGFNKELRKFIGFFKTGRKKKNIYWPFRKKSFTLKTALFFKLPDYLQILFKFSFITAFQGKSGLLS